MDDSKTPETITAELLDLLTSRGQSDYIGEAVSQLEHCLQCAHLASSNGASSETIIAALLHDIGQFLPVEEVRRLAGDIKDMKPAQSTNITTAGPDSGSVGRAGHETLGEMYLHQSGFSSKVCALVGSHVAAKRYLCAVDPAYHDTLSEASKQSLRFQGGPMQGEELERWGNGEWCMEMCQLRKWDDAAKVVGLDAGNPGMYKEMIEKHLTEQRALTV